MKKIAIWGTGSTAESLFAFSHLNENDVVCYIESDPKSKEFRKKPVLSWNEYDKRFDQLYIASMYYPEILQNLVGTKIELNKVKIVIDHLDNPKAGPIISNAEDILVSLEKYKEFSKTIDQIITIVESDHPKIFSSRLDNLTYAMSLIPESGSIVEFGVYRGETLNHLRNLTKRPVWGFDSFEGFAEGTAWSQYKEIGRANVELPNGLINNQYIVPGYFHETLPSWLSFNTDYLAFTHYDAGHYEAAKSVLNLIKPRLIPGSILVFDEFIPHQTELRADEFEAFIEEIDLKHRFLSRSEFSVTIQIVE